MPSDITGQKFGRLIAVAPAEEARSWLFKCDCGVEVTRDLFNVVRGRTTSCGCLKRELARKRMTKHGHSGGNRTSPTRRAYLRMLDEAGANVQQEWVSDFFAFIRDMGECPQRFRVARRDPDLPFDKHNCHYAPTSHARRSNVYVVHEGKRLILREFARVMDVDYDRLYNFVIVRSMELTLAVERIRKGKISPIEVEHDGRILNLSQFARAMNVNYNMLKKRVRTRNMDPHAAVDEIRSISNQTRATKPHPRRAVFLPGSPLLVAKQHASLLKMPENRFSALRAYSQAKQIIRCRATRRVLKAIRHL